MLAVFGIGAAGLGLAACGGSSGSTSSSSSSAAAAAAASGEIPDETAGPYPGDGSNGRDVLEQSGIVRTDIRSSFGECSGTAEGVPMTLELVVADLANGGAPFAGVAVYVWHCEVTLPVRIDTTTTPTGGQLSGDGAPSGAPGGRGGPPSRPTS
jgi:hypothetical protein